MRRNGADEELRDLERRVAAGETPAIELARAREAVDGLARAFDDAIRAAIAQVQPKSRRDGVVRGRFWPTWALQSLLNEVRSLRNRVYATGTTPAEFAAQHPQFRFGERVHVKVADRKSRGLATAVAMTYDIQAREFSVGFDAVWTEKGEWRNVYIDKREAAGEQARDALERAVRPLALSTADKARRTSPSRFVDVDLDVAVRWEMLSDAGDLPPREGNGADDELRDLERRAAAGDRDALAELDRRRIEIGSDVVFQVVNAKGHEPWSGLKWNVVVSRSKDHVTSGLFRDKGDLLNGQNLLVTFHDDRHKRGFSSLGQPLPGYYAATLVVHPPDAGLSMFGGEPSWVVDDAAMREVVARLRGLGVAASCELCGELIEHGREVAFGSGSAHEGCARRSRERRRPRA